MILFLDFDGVLHPLLRKEPDFCRLPLLWQILRAAPEVLVVFSTSWREVYRHDEMVEFVAYGGGEDLAHRIIGQTPRIKVETGCDRRDLEIQSWLEANNHSGPWLAIDDMPKLFNGGHPYLYVVDGTRGLTDEDVLAILERMNRIRSAAKLITDYAKTWTALHKHDETGEVDAEIAREMDRLKAKHLS